jgi:hypothetical protein
MAGFPTCSSEGVTAYAPVDSATVHPQQRGAFAVVHAPIALLHRCASHDVRGVVQTSEASCVSESKMTARQSAVTGFASPPQG